MAYELIATTHYIPDREVFFVQVDLSDYLLEYYHHRHTFAPNTSQEHDDLLKTLISCFAIHLALRTTVENHAWTLQMVSSTPFSLFVAGNTGQIDKDGIANGFLVGHVLTDSVRHTDTSAVHAQYACEGKTSKSYVECENSNIVAMVQKFYTQSEQRPLRISISQNSDKAIGMMALPDCDLKWFEDVDIETILSTAEQSVTKMRDCRFSFHCDCAPEKLLPFFKALNTDELNEIYGADSQLAISCPRCGRVFWIDRSMV